jgi:hypothetical protein
VPIFFKNRLHLAGRPQMSTRPSAAFLFEVPEQNRRLWCRNFK